MLGELEQGDDEAARPVKCESVEDCLSDVRKCESFLSQNVDKVKGYECGLDMCLKVRPVKCESAKGCLSESVKEYKSGCVKVEE